MFELTKNEFEILRSQFASSSWGGLRYAPMAFTEHGVLKKKIGFTVKEKLDEYGKKAKIAAN